MRHTLAFLSLCIGSVLLSQTHKVVPTKTTVKPVDTSKAHAWAEAVTDFIADRRLLQTFHPNDVAEHFKMLIPPAALKPTPPGIGEDNGIAPDGNPEKGIVGLEYELDDLRGGLADVSWVTVFMKTKDPDGQDVAPRVVAAMKRKLHRPPWRFYSYPGGVYTWEHRKAFLLVTVQVAESLPEKNGTPGPGPWVRVALGRVEGFDEDP